MIIQCDKCKTIHGIYYDCENPPEPKRSMKSYIGLLCFLLGFALGVLVSYWGQS